MTFVVTEPCIRCKYTDCVDVCPVDAFREGPNFLVIDPDAIYAEEDVPKDQQDFTPLNADLSLKWKTITRTKPSLPDADDWSIVQDKRGQLIR